MNSSVERVKSTLNIETSACEIEERGVKLKLTVVDTPGFGDGINNSEWWVQVKCANREHLVSLPVLVLM